MHPRLTIFFIITSILACRGFNKFWHKCVVQHNRRVLFRKAFLSRGSWACSPPPGKFWNPRLSHTLFPAFWGLFLFCFVVLRSQPIWTNLEQKKNWTSTQINSRKMNYFEKKKEHDIKVWPQKVGPFDVLN